MNLETKFSSWEIASKVPSPSDALETLPATVEPKDSLKLTSKRHLAYRFLSLLNGRGVPVRPTPQLAAAPKAAVIPETAAKPKAALLTPWYARSNVIISLVVSNAVILYTSSVAPIPALQ